MSIQSLFWVDTGNDGIATQEKVNCIKSTNTMTDHFLYTLSCIYMLFTMLTNKKNI